MTSSFWQQLKALLRRNLTLKKRMKRRSIQEFFMPIYFSAILAAIHLAIKPTSSPPVPYYPPFPINETPHGGELLAPHLTRFVAFYPNSSQVYKLSVNIMTEYHGVIVRTFLNGSEAEAAYNADSSRVWAGVEFKDPSLQSGAYMMRMGKSAVPTEQTGLYVSGNDACGANAHACDVNKYVTSGFAMLQMILDSQLMKMMDLNVTVTPPWLQFMPTFDYISNIEVIQILSGLYYVMSYAPFISFLTVSLVTEKEKKVKEAMRMMGLRDSVFWLSWSLIYFVLICLVTFVITLIALLVKFFPNSNLGLFFLCLLCYGMSIVNMAFLISPFFNKAETAGGAAGFCTLLFSLLYLAVSLTRKGTGPDGPINSIPTWGIFLLCLLSPTALALSLDQYVFLDAHHDGANFSNLNMGAFSIQYGLIMLVVDIVLYGFLAFYLDNVLPNEFGQRRPAWFIFLPSYWCVPKAELKHREDYGSTEDLAMEERDEAVMEPIPIHLHGKEAIRIKDIRKIFKNKADNKEIRAVDGITLDIYEGQITAILGHNGAGKTTLFNMLSGTSPPTSGTATIYGLDVRDSSSVSTLRTMTGVCPQHNSLFEVLTCREHLRFYGIVKGVSEERIDGMIDKNLADVSLLDQGDALASELSGGQKRKLSVAIALIGDPKVIFLDEPTAGMDPASRRHLWSMLKERQAGKVILLTTHFMDEADILADRKAFIKKGRLVCCGSSLFLKNNFGVGYHLTMVVEPGADIQPITSLVLSHILEAKLERQHGKEVSYILPVTSADKFAELFASLEEKSGSGTKASEIGVLSYGVSMTDLEEVFLKLEGDGEDEDDASYQQPASENIMDGDQVTLTNNMHVDGVIQSGQHMGAIDLSELGKATVENSQLVKNRIYALVRMRIRMIYRLKLRIFLQVILPIIFTCVGAAILTTQPTYAPSAPIELDISNLKNDYLATNESNVKIKLDYVGGSIGVDHFKDGIEAQGIQTRDISNYSDLNKNNPPHHLGFDVSGMPTNITALYNVSLTHGLPVLLNIYTNALISETSSTSSINISSKPWPSSEAQSTSDLNPFNGSLFGSVIILGMALSMVPAMFASLTVAERENKSKSQLRISGVSIDLFWLTQFIVDFSQYLFTALVCFGIQLAFQIDSVSQPGAIISLLLLFVFYLPVNLFFCYLIGFMFDKYETAARTIPPMLVWLGFLPYIAVSVVDGTGYPDIARYLHLVLVIVDPTYVMFGGLYFLNKVYMTHSILYGVDTPVPTANYFTWESNLLPCYTFPLITAVILYFLLRYVEIKKTGGDPHDVFCMGSGNLIDTAEDPMSRYICDDEDEDVKLERQKVEGYQPRETEQPGETEPEPVVVVQGLRKEFVTEAKKRCCKKEEDGGIKVAVKNNNFMVMPGDVFGLLGPNGAGKTTTLNMVIAEEGPTAGQVYVSGHNVRSSLSEAFQAMGYCPQHDPLWDFITVREHLETYGIIRGIPVENAGKVAQYFIDSLKIQEHANKIGKDLSGGTKRKLTYAIAMLGLPRVVLLDEPSTGMDPRSKRFLWDTISASFADADRGAILTTHYMEEADALCSRVGIMVNGQMECLGTTQHLKSRFGSGYSLEVKMVAGATAQETAQRMQYLQNYIKETFPSAVQTECFAERAIYKVPADNVTSLAQTFDALEKGKQDYHIQEYSFSQATLEQVFLEFARHQLEEGDDDPDDERAVAAKKTHALMRQVSVQSGDSSGPGSLAGSPPHQPIAANNVVA